MDVFDLLAKISLDTSEYENSLNDAESKTSKFGDGLKSGLGTAAKVGGAAVVALGTAIAGGSKMLIDGASATAQYGDEIDKASQKLGLSAESYQEWDFILQHSGSSVSALTGVMKTLNTNIESGSEAFEQLGISQEELANLSTEEVFARTITALQGITDEQTRNALASDTLGKKYAELNPLLNTSAEDTEAMRQAVHDLGGVMSDDAVKDSARFQDSLQDAQYAVDGLKRSFLSELLPSFSDVLDGFSALVSGTDESGKQFATGIEKSVDAVTRMLPRFLSVGGKIIMSVVKGISQNLPQIVKSAQEMLSTLIDGFLEFLPQLLEMAPEIFQNVLDLIVNVVQQVVDALPQIIQTIAEVLPDMIRMLATALPEIIDAILSALPEIITAICDALPDIVIAIIEVLPKLIADIAKAVFENFPAILLAVVQGLGTILSEIGTWFAGLIGFVDEEGDGIWDNVSEWFSNIINNIGEWFSNIFNSIKDFFVNAAVEFVNWQNETKQKISNFFSNIISKVVDFVKKIPEKIREGISKVTEVGKNLVQGLWNGISDAAGWVLDKIKGFGQSILDGIKNIFGIKSPSREMAWIGQMLDEGLAGGISKFSGDVIDEAMNVMSDLSDTFASPLAISSTYSAFDGNSSTGVSRNNNIGTINLYVYGSVNQNVDELADEVIDRLQRIIIGSERVYA